MAFRIAGVASHTGDQPLAARRMVEAMQIDSFLLRYLSPGALAWLAWQREQDAGSGYVEDFTEVLKSLSKQLASQTFTIVTDAGGLNPAACAAAAGRALQAAELGGTSIGIVTGDDLTDHPSIPKTPGMLLHANAQFGSDAVAGAFRHGARIVITGAMPAASLVGGACSAHFGWEADSIPQYAGAAVAAQVLEGGAAATGGNSTRWSKFNPSTSTGYPVAEIAAGGSCIITRPPRSGGVVNRHTVIEQLLTGVENPQAVQTPDTVLDLSAIRVEELPTQGATRAGVQISGAAGKPPGSDYIVSASYQHGYEASGLIFVYGRDCVEKAEACAAMVFDRLRRDGFEYAQSRVDYPGAGQLIHPASAPPEDLRELTLCIAARDNNRENIARFIQELSTLSTSAPAGITLAATPQIHPTFIHRQTSIPRSTIQPEVTVRTADEWAAG